MKLTFFRSPRTTRFQGVSIPGALDRQQHISGFDQQKYSRAHVLCIGAGGLIGNIASALVRKGVGELTILDPDEVEASNLNRQHFFRRDIGKNKAVRLVRNLRQECTYATVMTAYPMSLETMIYRGLDLSCDVAICGIDNNVGRVAAAKFFRQRVIPVIFAAVSADTDHGYVFIQKASGPCIGCVLPHVLDDGKFPCPGTPAISDILRLIGALAVYGADGLLTERKCEWNYRAVYLSSGEWDSVRRALPNPNCRLCAFV